jgi:hypothetical protein
MYVYFQENICGPNMSKLFPYVKARVNTIVFIPYLDTQLIFGSSIVDALSLATSSSTIHFFFSTISDSIILLIIVLKLIYKFYTSDSFLMEIKEYHDISLSPLNVLMSCFVQNSLDCSSNEPRNWR